MRKFGELLRYYRRHSRDNERGGMLTQARLGELIGHELGDSGYSGAAISGWEHGKSQISPAQYPVLLALVEVLNTGGGIQTPTEANTFLIAGNFRPLSKEEQIAIFSEDEISQSKFGGNKGQWGVILQSVLEMAHQLKEEMQRMVPSKADEQSPHGSFFFWDMLGQLGDNLTSEKLLRAIGWITTWLLVWQLTFPLMRWPFINETQSLLTITSYIGGALVLPIFIGGLTNTKDDEFWQRQELAESATMRLYTHQGAILGFHLGYVLVFGLRLVSYYFGLGAPAFWFEGLTSVVIVVISSSAARQIPFNLWRAFGELSLKDGAIFFIFALFGPLFGALFNTYYSFLLVPAIGIPLILLALFIFVGLTVWQKRRTGSSVIPAHIWAAIFGAALLLYQTTIAPGLYSLAVLSSMVGIIIALLAWDYANLTVLKALFGLLTPLLPLLAFRFNAWVGLVTTLMIIGVCGRWRQFAWIPWSFWGVIITSVIGGLLLSRGVLSETQASIGVILISTIIILEKRRMSKRILS